jgi:hypothetical protein
LLAMKSIVLLNVTPCNLVEIYVRFGRTYYLHLQGRRVGRAIKQAK